MTRKMVKLCLYNYVLEIKAGHTNGWDAEEVIAAFIDGIDRFPVPLPDSPYRLRIYEDIVGCGEMIRERATISEAQRTAIKELIGFKEE